MIDQKETIITMWQDNHSGRRGHQLMTQELADTIPALGANANVADCDNVLAPAKLFSPYSNWTWYITEMDPETGQCFGLVEGLSVSWATLTCRSWPKPPSSAAFPPWSATSIGNPRPWARSKTGPIRTRHPTRKRI